jgi:hypothetical protein
MNPDIIGMAEVDGSGGKSSDAYVKLVKMMASMGYDYSYFEKFNHVSGSAVFHKQEWKLVESRYVPYTPGSNQGYMMCHFQNKKAKN